MIANILVEHRRALIVVVGVLAAFALRYFFIPIETYDYRHSVSGWYAFIVENGYFAALQYDFSNYNVPYLYLLAAMAALLPGLHSLVAVKAISMLFDLALAYFVYKCVEHKHPDSKSVVPILAGIATLLAPTVVLNSSAWGQTEAIYTTFLVACLYFLLASRQAMALVAFGLAVSFKLQAVFLAPLFLWLIGGGGGGGNYACATSFGFRSFTWRRLHRPRSSADLGAICCRSMSAKRMFTHFSR